MEVIFCVGISGSGKSTWTEQWLKEHPNYIRVNRDSLRKALIGNSLDGYYQREDLNKLEEIVNSLTKSIIIGAAAGSYNIVVDNTNLRLKYLTQLQDSINIKTKLLGGKSCIFKYKLFDCDLTIAKNRVLSRDFNEVLDFDEAKRKLLYIEKQYNDYNNIKRILLLNPENIIE